MSSKSDYLENRVLNCFLRNVAAGQTASVFAALFTAAPSDAGGGTEVSGNSYARRIVTFGAAAGGAVANDTLVTFNAAQPAGWGTITHGAIFDAFTAGNMLYWFPLTSGVVIDILDIFQFPIGDLDITES